MYWPELLEAIESQRVVVGASVCIHVEPKFEEYQIPPTLLAPAARYWPVLSEAMQ